MSEAVTTNMRVDPHDKRDAEEISSSRSFGLRRPTHNDKTERAFGETKAILAGKVEACRHKTADNLYAR